MDNVLVQRAQLQQLLNYMVESEYTSYLEHIEENGSGENHIYSIVESIQAAIDSQ